MDERGVAVAPPHGRQQLVHQRQVGVPPRAALARAHVQGGAQEILVVRADVDHHRHAGGGLDAAARRVQRDSAQGDADGLDAEVPELADALAVGQDHDAHVALGPVLEDAEDAAAVLERHKEAARQGTEHKAVALAGEAHGGRRHDGEQLLKVLEQHAVVQALVAVLQRGHVGVLVERVLLAAHV